MADAGRAGRECGTDTPSAPAGETENRVRIRRAKTKYKGREIAVTMHYLGAPWLMRESRQREEDCATLLEPP